MISLASARDDAQIVADEEIGEAVPLLQIAQQIDDLRLHRHVERRGRLVEHDEFRLEHHRAGDRDALALAAGEFVRVAIHGAPDRADVGERARDASRSLRRRELGLLHARPSSTISATDRRGDSEPKGS